MKTLIISFFVLLTAPALVTGQEKYYTRNGHVDFFSHTPLEDIKADNDQVAVFLNVAEGSISAAMLMKSFMFEKALMQQHFNENYVESDEYPRAEFEGNIKDFASLDFKTQEAKNVTAIGKITLHGVTRDLSVDGTILKKNEHFHIKAKFTLKPADFDIHIPPSVKEYIAEEIEVNLSAQLVAM